MGEQSTSLLEAAVETPVEPVDDNGVAGSRRRPTRGMIAGIVVGALVVAGGTVGGVAWANRVAHDNALADAREAHATAAHSVAAHRATLVWLETSAATAIVFRDGVATGVLAHQDALGGADAVAPVVASDTGLAATLAELFGVEAPTVDTAIPDVAPAGEPATVDPELTTDELTALADDLVVSARQTDAARVQLASHADEVDAGIVEVEKSLQDLASALPAVHQSLLDGHPLASEQAKATAAAALAALPGASSGSGLPALFDAYASSAAGIVAAHDAEVARLAAEAARIAAEEAAKKQRSAARGGSGGSGSTGGGGGGGTEQRGVLSETNAQRAANSLGALSWNGTLASRSCSFAAQLAANNGGLSHSSFQGGFSAWGENVAYGYGSASAVVAGWMGSSGHRANILGSYSMMGACSATSTTGRIYWVQQFGA